METPGYSMNTILHSSITEKAKRAVFFLLPQLRYGKSKMGCVFLITTVPLRKKQNGLCFSFLCPEKEDSSKKNRITIE